MNKMKLLWALSLSIIGVCTVILAGSNIIGIELPGALTRVLGIIDLICLPVLVFASVKMVKRQ